MAGPRDLFSAGADRAAGERAKRTRTPLLHEGGEQPASAKVDGVRLSVVPPPGAPDPATPPPRKPARKAAAASPPGDLARHRPHPVANSVPGPGTSGMTYRPRSPALRDEQPKVNEQALAAALNRQELTPKVEDLLAALIGALRTVAAASGKRPDEVEETVARTLSYLARRVTGQYVVDEFGFDKDWTEHVFLPLMRLPYRQWFRVEVRGIEHIPADGAALIVSNHAGTIAFDALMVQVAVHDEHPNHRNLRLLGGDLVFRTPIIADVSRKQGSTLAALTDAERLLSRGEVVGVFPEGYKGVGKPFSERYKLQRFGRGGFVSAAVRTGAPIIPLSVVGSEETYPLLANVPALARLLNTPYFPITPTWPWLGPLGLIPLPSKWIMEFGEPVETAHMGKGAADDPMLVFDLTDQIRETIQQTLYSLLSLRRTAFS
ncbi:MAG: 1-acyl-sn-glycerol-3-phosphate acyltransferase [Dermatophilaceae bacterium]